MLQIRDVQWTILALVLLWPASLAVRYRMLAGRRYHAWLRLDTPGWGPGPGRGQYSPLICKGGGGYGGLSRRNLGRSYDAL